MGDPFLKLNNRVMVKVNGFFFNVAMTVFREESEKRVGEFPSNSVVARVAAQISRQGLEHVMDTVMHCDDFISTEDDRARLAQWLRHLLTRVIQPDFQIPEAWQRLLRGEIGGTPPIPITREHFLGIAYVFQVMLDLVEGKIPEGRHLLNTTPPGWEPKT